MTTVLLIPIAILVVIHVFLLSVKNPRIYMWLYLLASTQFMGFVDFTKIEIRGLFNVLFYLNVITILSIVVLAIRKGIPDNRGFRFLCVIGGLVVFGIFYPLLLGYSAISSSIIDGKDFLCYFFLAFLLLNADTITPRALSNVVTFIGLGLSIIVIIASATGMTPPAFTPVLKDLGPQHGIHISFSTYICLAFFLQFGHIYNNKYKAKHILILLILLAGIILQPHRSVFFGTLAGVLLLISCKSSLDMKIRSAYVIVVLFSFVYLVLGTEFLSENLFGPVQELFQREGAIAARDNIDAFRWDEIWNRPLLGHGFIDETSSFGQGFYLASNYRFSQALSTIDSGYVDTLIRFGVVGTFIILIQYLAVLTIPFRMEEYGTVERLMSAAFLATYFVISITWSVFTYKHGIIPAAIAICLIVRTQSGHADTDKKTIGSCQYSLGFNLRAECHRI